MPYKDPEKQKAAQHKAYLKQRPAQIARNRALRAERRSAVDEYKLARGCGRCAYAKSARALDAHHLDGEVKEKGICEMIRDFAPLARIFEELAKCEILCANCHREQHAPIV